MVISPLWPRLAIGANGEQKRRRTRCKTDSAGIRTDGSVILWDAATGERIHTMTRHSGYITQIAFVGNDRLISAADDGTVRLWHVPLSQFLCTLYSNVDDRCVRFAVSPNHRHLACRLSSGPVRILDISRP